MKDRIPLLRPHTSGSELNWVTKALEQNMLANDGDNIDGFEKVLRQYYDTEVSCLNSGTSSIHLALIILGVSVNDIVICPSFSFCATTNPVKYLGATPVFVDCEPSTWNMDPEYLKEAIEYCISNLKRPKAIIVADNYGIPADWNKIKSISDHYEIPVIEDAAEAMGSFYYDKPCGTLADIGVLSFNGNKIVTTSSGGAILLKNKRLKKRADHLASQAKIRSNAFEHDEIGYNYRMSNVQAGIGIGQFLELENKLVLKRKLHEYYCEHLSVYNLEIKSASFEGVKPNNWMNNLVFHDKNFLNEIIRAFNSENIGIRYLWTPLHKQKPYKDCVFFGKGYCEQLYDNGISIPSSTNLTDDEKKRILNVFAEVSNYLV